MERMHTFFIGIFFLGLILGCTKVEDLTAPKEANNTEEINSLQKPDKVTICHKPRTPAQKTLIVPRKALNGHLGHGDTMGECGTPQCVDAPSGLIAWWPGDGNTDDIINSHHGTLQDGASFSAGMVDQAFSFDGDNDYVSIPDHADWTFGDDPFTIDCWVNFSAIPERAPFVDHNEGGGSTRKWVLWYDEWGHREPFNEPALRFHINSPTLGALDPVIYPWAPTTGVWYHVAITRYGSNYSLYIDGEHKITETDANTIPDAEVELSLGQSELSYWFNGQIDEVEIFNRALDASEIKAIYDAGSLGKCK